MITNTPNIGDVLELRSLKFIKNGQSPIGVVVALGKSLVSNGFFLVYFPGNKFSGCATVGGEWDFFPNWSNDTIRYCIHQIRCSSYCSFDILYRKLRNYIEFFIPVEEWDVYDLLEELS